MVQKVNHKFKHIYTLQTTVQIVFVLFLIIVFTFARYSAGKAKIINVEKLANTSGLTSKPESKPKSSAVSKPSTATKTAPVVSTPAPVKPAAQPPAKTPVATTTPGTGVHSLSPAPASISSSGTSSTSTGDNTPPANSYTSLNWAGYLSNSGTYSAISSSWVVPTATGNGTTASTDATWIGIGGVSSNDLIQAGTENTVEPNGQVFSAAFYELLPDSAKLVPTIAVSPGDSITTNIFKESGNLWSINVTDNTNSQTFSVVVAYASSLSSAEWIEEDPSFTNFSLAPFDNFGKVSFSSGLTTLNGTSSSISASGSSSITLVSQSDQPLATPTSLGTDGASFSVNRN